MQAQIKVQKPGKLSLVVTSFTQAPNTGYTQISYLLIYRVD